MKEIPAELIELLSDGEYHSGEIVGDALGVSRAAVWKKLKGLEAFGVDVESVKGKGYRLSQAVSLFSESGLKKITTDHKLPDAIMFNVTDSTNTQLLARSQNGHDVHEQIVVAEQQTAGRGRRGKTWVSPYAANLYFSMAWDFEQGAAKLDGLSLVVGLALQQSVYEFCGVRSEVKWPNDVLVEGKKLAGILLEISGDPTGLCHVIIGVGVNINMHDGKGEIDQPWQSLALLSHSVVDKTEFLSVFVKLLLTYLDRFVNAGFSSFSDQWKAVDALQGQAVMLTQGDQVILGEHEGVSEKGELLIRTALGIEVFNGGEVSVRKQS
ncbi:MAG: bifunctional biotin--[acetyl-CoA-carboxylase] ligase/biotin operon repressor BirA [Sinobacterium sp.]|nr:bifunctional biotin--[acetyl-CoA-carboxylase] ligase/biotin operon repressor BirA [Sinobacterium sp.]